MIAIESITIKEFRGIRDLTLKFDGKNFGIGGPNGTGKSGIVDAIEFALTGAVSRLSGEGRGEVSVKEHGAHVDRRNNPDKARVILTVSIPSLGKSATITRSVKAPTAPTLSPSDADVAKVLRHVEDHPEIVLSRRELIRYVLATPGKRAEEVQALLHLEQIEKVRAHLQRIANRCERPLESLEMGAAEVKANLLQALGIAELTAGKVLGAANAQRVTLGLPILSQLTDKTSLADGLAAPAPAQAQAIPKVQAIADINAARTAVAGLASQGQLIAELNHDFDALAADPSAAEMAKREAFLSTGADLVIAEMCPFCDTPWNPEDLKRHAQAKIEQLQEATKKRGEIDKKLLPLTTALHRASNAVQVLAPYAALAKPPINFAESAAYGAGCKGKGERLSHGLSVDDARSILDTVDAVPEGVLREVDELEKAVAGLPDPSKQDAARVWLTVAQERLENYRTAMRRLKAAKTQAEISCQAAEVYTSASDRVLAQVYKAVEADFAALYAFVNRVDEKDFKARLVPSMGKLGFGVDFYGRGFFPPGAYHSEGHQDSMGLCLYLALMRHIQSGQFTVAVLDDVLMSVDAGHRREVCKLLKREFPNTQFIMTTHDPIWLQHMKTEGLTGPRASVQFRQWTVEHGPSEWDDRDVWMEIEEYLKRSDVRPAAAVLRGYLEYTASELCHRLRAPVPYHGDAQYELGELMPAAIHRLRRLYAKGSAAANSWGQKDRAKHLAGCSAGFSSLADASKAEQWQVNTAIHFNNWENLTKEDFQPVVDAFRNLLGGFACAGCGEYLFVSPDRESADALRCGCGDININLKEK